MTGLAILDVAIGLVFVYLLLSMLCTIVNEMISSVVSLRATTLRKGIQDLLADPNLTGLAKEVCAHPLIKNCGKKSDMPSYIPSATFARALIDVIEKGGKTTQAEKGTIGGLKTALKTYEKTDAGKALLVLVGQADATLEAATKNIEQWFDDSMDRVSGWYKRRKQIISLGVALVIAVGLNANSFVIAEAIHKDESLRQAFVKQAEAIVNDCKNKKPEDCRKSFAFIKKELQPLPLGRKSDDFFPPDSGKLFSIFGWLLTALAISMGAPFWFDVLNKLNSIRMTGKKPKTSAEKAAEKAAGATT